MVLSHYHTVCVLGAAAFEDESIIAHGKPKFLIDERGKQTANTVRIPRLFKEPDSIPGLTHSDYYFNARLEIPLGGDHRIFSFQ